MFQKITGAKSFKIAIILVAVFFVLLAVVWGFEAYLQWKGEKEVKNLAEMLEKIKAEDYRLAMADTYGGKTPQETLQMYISAVEKGDYELASKYFVIAKQEKEKITLNKAKNINDFLKILYQLKNNINAGRYSQEKNWFRIDKPVSIEFMLYPNGIWKIIEI